MALTRAKLTSKQQGFTAIELLINPTELSVTRTVNYAEQAIPGLEMPLLQFVRGQSDQLQFELFLDRASEGSSGLSGTRNGIADDLVHLRSLVRVNKHTHAPPIVTLEWGTTTNQDAGSQSEPQPRGYFTGVVTSLTERFVLFMEDGTPERARVSLTLKSWESPDAQVARIDRQSPDRSRTWVVQEGDRLSAIAAHAYGDPSLWRHIAQANDIQRPRDLQIGALLNLPAI